MSRDRDMVQFCIDAIVARSLISKCVDIHIRVDVEHNSVKYSNNIYLDEGSSIKTLDINEKLYIDNNNPDYSAIVSIYVEEMKIYEKVFDLRQNMIGAIISDVYFPFCLIFRIINDQVNDIVIYNVPKYKLSDFEVVETLGKGSSGVAYKAIDDQGHPHVLKVPNTKIDINNPNSNGMREIISLIALLRHPCMIRLDGFICNHNHGIILVLAYASRGQIDKIDFESLEESCAFKILYGLFSCVAFIHDHGFIHRDLHYKNILVTEDYEARLIDFDVSRFYGDDMTHNVGHQGFMAPEMMGNGYYDDMVDEFSLGVLISDIFDQSSPFYFLNYLLKSNATVRSTCSEICTLLECEYLIDITIETESYITELSKYHESDELSDSLIVMLIPIADSFCNKNLYFNTFKLFSDLDQRFKFLFSIFVLFDEAIALDTDYIFDIKIFAANIMNIRLIPDISLLKVDYLHNYYAQYYDKELVSEVFFTIFWSHDWSIYFLEYIDVDRIGDFFGEIIQTLENDNKVLEFNESLYRKAKKYNVPLLLYEFFPVLSKFYPIYSPIIIKYCEYFIDMEIFGHFKIIEKICHILSIHYINSNPPDFVKAKFYAKLGFKMGNFKCSLCLSTVYMQNGKIKKAIKYLKIAAEHGDAEAMFYLGTLYLFKELEQKGINYLRKSADKGYVYAQNFLSRMNFCGKFIPRNIEQAFWYNSLAMQQGCKEASYQHALFYFHGIVVEQDFVKAKILFEQSLETISRLLAIDKLSVIHMYGLGVEISITKANSYLSMLIQAGIPREDYPITVDATYIRKIREEAIPNILRCYRERDMATK